MKNRLILERFFLVIHADDFFFLKRTLIFRKFGLDPKQKHTTLISFFMIMSRYRNRYDIIRLKILIISKIAPLFLIFDDN